MFRDTFLSKVIGNRVLFTDGRKNIGLGKVTDVVVERLDDRFPIVAGIVIDEGSGRRYARSADILEVTEHGEIFLSDPVLAEVPADDLTLHVAKNLFDRDIETIDRKLVVRISDLEVVRDSFGALRIVAADISTVGLVRRMVGSKLPVAMLDRLPRRLIRWDNIVVASGKPLSIRVAEPDAAVAQLHPSELADIIRSLSPEDATSVFHALDDETAADALEYLEPDRQLALIENLPSQRVADIIEEMESDDAADLLGDMSSERRVGLFADMEPETAADLQGLIAHAGDTAGGMMTTEFVTIKPHQTTVATLNALRTSAQDIPFIYYLYVVDQEQRLIGIISLRTVILALPTAFVEKLMQTEIVSVSADMPAQDVAALIARYDLNAVPVLDDERRVIGIVTVDDAIDAVIPAHIKARRPGRSQTIPPAR